MKLLVIGTDVDIFDPRSEARSRIDEYGRLFEELHIVIYTKPGFCEAKTESGVFLYPTNARFWFLRPYRAYVIGRKIIQRCAIDCLSVENPSECGIAGLLLKWSCRVPFHVQIHADLLSPWYRKNSWKERVRFWLAEWIIPRADRIRVVSERVKHSLESRFAIRDSRITVLPIFVDRARIAGTLAPANPRVRYSGFRFVILMVTRFVREKNVAIALRAFRAVLEKFPDAGLVIVGDGPMRAALEREVARLGIQGSVRFEGWQNDSLPYYVSSDLYLLTSNFEGYSRSVVEAASSGLPIVMTDVGIAGDIIREGETGHVVGVGDEHALARAILGSFENYAGAKQMALRAREYVLSLEPRTREQYLELYRKALTS
jgi:glycosyltransferase involved in cell wall biosynthesis